MVRKREAMLMKPPLSETLFSPLQALHGSSKPVHLFNSSRSLAGDPSAPIMLILEIQFIRFTVRHDLLQQTHHLHAKKHCQRPPQEPCHNSCP